MGDRETQPDGATPPADPKGLLAQVLSATSDPVAVVSHDDPLVLWVNESLCSLLGSTREGLTGPGSGAIASALLGHTHPEEPGSPSDLVTLPGRAGPVSVHVSRMPTSMDGREVSLVICRPAVTPGDRSEAILQAAASAATDFLHAERWTDVMEDALGRLAEAAGTQRSFLFENQRRSDGSLWMIQRVEWCAPGVPGTGPIDKAYPYSVLYRRWEEVFSNDGVIAGPVASLPEPEQQPLRRDGVVSMVAVPVYVAGEWWGFVGFDDCVTEDAGSPAEVGALRVAAEALGAAIEHRSLETRLREVEITSEHLIERIPAVVYLESLEDGAPDIYLSPQYKDIYGADPQQRLNRPNAWKEMIHPDDLDEVLVESARSSATYSPFSAEYRICRPDGTIRWIRDECVLVRDGAGEPIYWLGLATDLTREKEAEARHRATEERFQALVEHLPVAPYIESPDADPSEFYMSPQIEGITGWTPEDFHRDPTFWENHIHPDDKDRVLEAERTSTKTGEMYSEDYRFLRPDGSYVWLHEESQMVTGPRGQALSQGVIFDVTEERISREAIESAEERYRSLVERLPIVVYEEVLPPGGYPEAGLAYLSPQFRDLYGWDDGEVSSLVFWDEIVHPDDRNRVVEESVVDSVKAGLPTTMEYRILTKSGEIRWMQDSSVLTRTEEDGTQVWLGTLIDITERARAEEQRSRANDILRAVAVAAERFLTASDWRDEMDVTLREVGEATGMSRSYLFEIRFDEQGSQRGWETYEWCAPGVRSTIDNPENQDFPLDEEDITWRRKLEAGQTAYGVASDYSLEDQEYFEREGIKSVLAVPVLVEGRWWGHLGFDDCFEERSWTEGEIESLRAAGGILSAAIERQIVLERLRETQITQQNLIDNLPGIVYMAPLGGAGEVSYVSPQYETILGYTQEERLADPTLWERICHPDDLERVAEASLYSDREMVPFGEEFRMYTRSGDLRWVRDDAIVVRDDQGQPRFWLGLIMDITERRRAEEALRRHDAILGAVGYAAQRFLAAESWEEEIDEVLGRLGAAGAASRCYLFRTQVGADGRTRADIVNEWCAEGVVSTMEDARMHGVVVVTPGDDPIPGWARTLAAEGVVRIDAVTGLDDPEEQDLLSSQGVTSLLEVGIFVGNEWWGWLGFDECREPRVWSQAEIDALRAAAGLLGSVVQRLDTEGQLRRSEERQRLLVERMPAVVYLDALDEMSTAIYISPQVEQMLGWTAEERIADPALWSESIHPEDRERVMTESLRTNATLEPFMIDYRLITRDGTAKWVRDEAVVIYDDDGNPLYWQGVLFDITERKQAEEELERTLALEREAVERLRALDDMKNTFLTAVSHDLRTPLAAVLGLALTLERSDIDLEPQVVNDLAQRIASNARKLERLVTDLLDVDRLSRGIVEPKLSVTDLELLARKVVSEADYLMDVPVVVDAEPVLIRVDTAKVERMIENLLANAVRHTPAGTTVTITVRREGQGALLAVEDDGPGVPPDLRESIFEPFSQGSEELSHSPGIGIGLSLVARFAELHGGHAWVAERPGGGASFRVFLPDAPETDLADAADTEEGGEA